MVRLLHNLEQYYSIVELELIHLNTIHIWTKTYNNIKKHVALQATGKKIINIHIYIYILRILTVNCYCFAKKSNKISPHLPNFKLNF